MKIISIHAGHDANMTFTDTEKNKYHIIEFERLTKKRYFRLHVDNSEQEIMDLLQQASKIAFENWGFDNDFDKLVFVTNEQIPTAWLARIFNFKSVSFYDHQLCHAASTFYQSGFESSLIISFDGGGNDGFFNTYFFDQDGYTLLDKIDCDFGGAYILLASCIKEIAKSTTHQLSLPGKMMGLCAYGVADENKSSVIKEFYIDRDYHKMSNLSGYDLLNLHKPWGDHSVTGPMSNAKFEGQESYNFAATAQRAFEMKFLEIFENYNKSFKFENICITGGAALNVLLNQRIKNEYQKNIFVAPNPNDCGLSLGASFLECKPNQKISVAYNGVPILDLEKMEILTSGRKKRPLDIKYVCELLKSGKIIGVCRDDSEVGPRALGNRSIICDPSFENMKDILNSKVKFREWFRPFAPFCLKKDAQKYFESRDFENFEFMSYAPTVITDIRKKVPSITHVDGTARLQVVTEESHKFFNELLENFSNYSDTNILLNTSFNIRGNPILTTLEDALYVLDNTELDCLILQDIIIEK